ncbi:MAG: hypothetical protein WHX52_23005 [Anaerolineae bacterium]
METRSSQSSHNFKNIALIAIWLLIGGILFSRYGHINLLFPIILLGWILVGVIVWRIARQRKIGNIVILLVLVLVLWLSLSLIYLGYASYRYDYALREFLMYVASGKESKLEFLPYADTCDWHVWRRDFTTDYQAKINDNFGIEMQWVVEFVNGSEYSIVMVPISLRRWEVCVSPHK